MKLEEILRFTIPGSTVVVALLVAFWPCFKCLVDDGGGEIIAALVLILVVPIGYLMHQIYRMCHQSEKGRFKSFKRPAFKLMKQKYKESEGCIDIEAWQARLAWDCWFGRCANERFANILSTQHIWWLSSKSMIVACSIGLFSLLFSLLLSLVLCCTGVWSFIDCCHLVTAMFFSIVYLALGTFFCRKAKSTGDYLLGRLEPCAVALHWNQIEPLLDRIVEECGKEVDEREKECQERPGIL